MEKLCIRRGKRHKRDENENSKVITHRRPVMKNHVSDCVLYEILLKLPVKTLVKFRLVSKSWRDLISSPQFIESHLALANIKVEENKSRINYIHFSSVDQKTLSLSILDPEASQVETICSKNNPFETGPALNLMGSCNGLILINIHIFFWLWNPSTGEYKKLPKCDYWPFERFPWIGSSYIFGLGYDSFLKDYKAVILCVLSPQQTCMYLCTSCSTDREWRRLDVSSHDFPYRMNNDTDNYSRVTINGSPHWVARDSDDGCSCIILFDMAEEKVKSLVTPHAASSTYSRIEKGCLELSILGGCLCATYWNFTHQAYDIWEMKEYGVKESWTKLFVIRRVRRPVCGLRPIGFINNGAEIIMERRGAQVDSLVSYDLKKKKQKFLLSTESNTTAIIFETLISP